MVAQSDSLAVPEYRLTSGCLSLGAADLRGLAKLRSMTAPYGRGSVSGFLSTWSFRAARVSKRFLRILQVPHECSGCRSHVAAVPRASGIGGCCPRWSPRIRPRCRIGLASPVHAELARKFVSNSHSWPPSSGGAKLRVRDENHGSSKSLHRPYGCLYRHRTRGHVGGKLDGHLV